jgi:2,3-bisphosphoglycerate-dependent phosphoglycerate mutase
MLESVSLRRGESLRVLENRFTGWTDVDLSAQGIREAHRADKLQETRGHSFDVAYTSVLRRVIRTLWIVVDEINLMFIPVYCSWRLNEGYHGAHARA